MGKEEAVEAEVLSLAMRPRTLDEVIGQDETVASLKTQIESGRIPRCWQIIGDSGNGKTTLARIIALSFQLPMEQFGSPTEDDWSRWNEFDIHEINGAHISGVEAIGQIAKQANFRPSPGSRKRVIFIDEAHQLSKQAMNLLLTPFEHPPKTTVWIIGTSEPGKLIPAFKRRCYTIEVKPLGGDDTLKLLKQAKKFSGFQGKLNPLAERLDLLGIGSPGLILNAFERYAAGVDVKKAVKAGVPQVDTIRICRAFLAGDWSIVAAELKTADGEQYRMIRLGVIGYLKAVMLSSGTSKKAALCSHAIEALCGNGPYEEGAYQSWVAAVLYRECVKFRA